MANPIATLALRAANPGEQCGICLNDHEVGSNVLAHEKTHGFCPDCIRPWVGRGGRQASCPCCRVHVIIAGDPQDPAAGAVQAAADPVLRAGRMRDIYPDDSRQPEWQNPNVARNPYMDVQEGDHVNGYQYSSPAAMYRCDQAKRRADTPSGRLWVLQRENERFERIQAAEQRQREAELQQIREQREAREEGNARFQEEVRARQAEAKARQIDRQDSQTSDQASAIKDPEALKQFISTHPLTPDSLIILLRKYVANELYGVDPSVNRGDPARFKLILENWKTHSPDGFKNPTEEEWKKALELLLGIMPTKPFSENPNCYRPDDLKVHQRNAKAFFSQLTPEMTGEFVCIAAGKYLTQPVEALLKYGPNISEEALERARVAGAKSSAILNVIEKNKPRCNIM